MSCRIGVLATGYVGLEVAGEALSAFGIVAFAANAIVDRRLHGCRSNCREARVAPLVHAPGEAGIQHALSAEEVE